jgi:hypothetical protein
MPNLGLRARDHGTGSGATFTKHAETIATRCHPVPEASCSAKFRDILPPE